MRTKNKPIDQTAGQEEIYQGICCNKKLFTRWDFKIITILCILSGIVMTWWQTNIIYDEIQETQAIQIFFRMDDLAHEELADMEAKGNSDGFTWTEMFTAIDKGFHNAESMEERFEWARKMDDLLDDIDTNLQTKGINTNDDQMREIKHQELHTLLSKLR